MSNRVVQMTQMLFRAEDSCADNLILNTIEAGFTKYVEQKVQEYCHHSITCDVKHLSSDCSVLSDEGAREKGSCFNLVSIFIQRKMKQTKIGAQRI